ncbi:hypothetical protein PROFUN_14283 [Planoprotostelium fungivorum]|uniref:C2 domain-containing protein n=1 Tax=Planoprotostelium fungivorum TaxID=1890364 RepID=A0A2P6N0I9_9EUKA|nr:hypothetical protein PROFUN_14283 [Planoprotostelium fungivorum]
MTGEKRRVRIEITDGVVYKATDDDGKSSDPYVQIGECDDGKWGKKLLETPVQKKTLQPKWNYTGETIIKMKQDIIIRMYDQDTFFDDYVGQYITYYNGTTNSMELKLSQNGEAIPKMVNATVNIKFTDLGSA